MLLIINIITISLFVIFCIKEYKKMDYKKIIAISLIIGGGLGNIIDRIFRGYVIDYIDINNLFNYPVFNIADICIVLGVVIIILILVFDTKKIRS